jgi:hypothetical protein
MARFRFLGLSPPVNEATGFRATTEHGEEAPRLAARTEKRANKNVKIRLLLLVVRSGEAKPKISFPFFVGSPHTPRRKSEIKEGKFLVFAPATAGSGRGAQNPSVRFSFKPPRTRSVRYHLFWK